MPHRALACAIGLFLLFAGITHFTNPNFFNDIVPPWLPPNESFWTYVSGAFEIGIAVLLLQSRTQRLGALSAAWLFVAVYPANIYMAWDWRHRGLGDQIISYGRLPFQFLFIWMALVAARPVSTVVFVPGDVDRNGYVGKHS